MYFLRNKLFYSNLRPKAFFLRQDQMHFDQYFKNKGNIIKSPTHPFWTFGFVRAKVKDGNW